MSEIVARQRPSVDLDDFERRLRQSQGGPKQEQAAQQRPGTPHGYDDDPLTELARLVSQQHDPYGDVFAQEAAPRQAQSDGRHEPAFSTAIPRLSADFASIEAGLRGALAAHTETNAGMPGGSVHDSNESRLYANREQPYPDQSYAVEQDQQGWAAPAEPRQSARSRRPIYAMVATIAVGIIGIGVAFAYKGASSSPREIKTIMAAAGPTKVQPPADAAAGQDGQATAASDKSQSVPTKLVSREEQPVDLSQAVQDNAARNGMNQGTDASSVPVPLSPSQARDSAGLAGGSAPGNGGDASAAAIDSGFGAGMPAPKKVKVVSVRPDGTIMPTGDAQQVPAIGDAAPRADAPVAPVAQATAKSAKSAKSTSRVATKPMSIAAAADANDTAPVAKPTKATKKTKPQRVASADPEDKVAAPDQTAQGQTQADAEPKVSGSGGFAVQLAAPGSEAEAKAATSRLGKKFADVLSGRHLGFHKADSNGRSVFRVRVSSLSKEDASELCDKVKSEGGSCFVAKN